MPSCLYLYNIIMERRRQPTTKERLTPCECCEFPVSHRHHILEFAQYGENNITKQLCGSCHDVYTVLVNCYTKPTKRNKDIWMGFVGVIGWDDRRVKFFMNLLQEYCDLKFDNVYQTINLECNDWEIEE